VKDGGNEVCKGGEDNKEGDEKLLKHSDQKCGYLHSATAQKCDNKGAKWCIGV
jgi:hypothetical protein